MLTQARPLPALALALALLAPLAGAQEAEGLRVALDPGFVSLLPGGAGGSVVVLHNGLGRPVTLALEATPAEGSELDTTLARGEVALAPGETARVPLEVNASERASPGTFHVRVHARGADGANATADLAVGVGRGGGRMVLAFTAQVTPLHQGARHGEVRNVTLRVASLRDAPGALSIGVAPPVGLAVDAPEMVSLGARETRDVPLRVAVADDAPLGPLVVNLSVRDLLSSHSGSVILLGFAVEVTLAPEPTVASSGGGGADPTVLLWGAAGFAAAGAVAGIAWGLRRRG